MKRGFVIVAYLLLCVGIAHGQAYWQVKSKKMPYPVTGGQAVYDLSTQGTKIYILGGYSDSLQQVVDWIQEYDANADDWKMVGHMLQPRKQFVAGIWKGNIVYFGGANDTSTSKTTLEMWNLITKSTPTVYDLNTDFGRSFATGYVVDDVLYVFGGSPPAGGKISYIASYNLLTKKISWNYDFASEDKPREPMTFIVRDNIFIFGGAFNGVIDKIQKFSIPSQKGEYLNYKLLEKRAGGSAVYSTKNKKGFLIAGYNESFFALRTVEEVIVNWDGSLNISKVPSLKYARNNPMAVDYQGIIAVFGGRDSTGKVVPYVETLIGVQTATDVKSNILLQEFALDQNYPNPFNPSTTIKYQLPKASYVSLKIYDILGREVITLVDEYKQAGFYNSKFSMNDSQTSSGIYFAQLRSGNTVKTIKMMLLK